MIFLFFSETASFKWNGIQSRFRLVIISILAITKDGPPGSELSKAFFREEYQLNYEIGILSIFSMLYKIAWIVNCKCRQGKQIYQYLLCLELIPMILHWRWLLYIIPCKVFPLIHSSPEPMRCTTSRRSISRFFSHSFCNTLEDIIKGTMKYLCHFWEQYKKFW